MRCYPSCGSIVACLLVAGCQLPAGAPPAPAPQPGLTTALALGVTAVPAAPSFRATPPTVGSLASVPAGAAGRGASTPPTASSQFAQAPSPPVPIQPRSAPPQAATLYQPQTAVQLAALQSPAGVPGQVVQPASAPLQPVAAQQPLPQPPAPVAAQGFTLEQLEHIAVSNNPSLARVAAEIEAARGNWLQVGLPPNPVTGYSGQQLGSGGLAEQHGWFAEQEWVRGNKLGLNRQVAAQEVSKAEHRYQVQCLRVKTDLRLAFYAVLVAQRQQQLAAELQDIAAQGLTNAEKLFQAQEVGRGDVVQARLELENARILVDNSANRAAASWRSLAAVTGVPGLAEQPLQGALEHNLPEYSFSQALQQLLACSPELAVATAEAERARWAFQRAGVEKTPNITFQGLINWQDNGIGGGSDGALVASLPLPLWNRNQGGVSKAYAEIAAAEQALRQLEAGLQYRLAPVFEQYASARQQVERYQRSILPAADEALALVQKTYQASETNYASLLVAQRTFAQTRLGYLQALEQLREAQCLIEGLLLRGSLEQP